jgi:hypothetical protein
VTTNLETGGTFTNVFTSNRRDHRIVDNGDGTITITVFASGGSRFYDANGKLVLRDPGQFRFAFDIDYTRHSVDPATTRTSLAPTGYIRSPHRKQRPSRSATSARTLAPLHFS